MRVSHHLATIVAAGFAAATALVATAHGEPEAAPRLIFRSVTVVPMNRPGEQPGRDVVVDRGRVSYIGPAGSAKARATDVVIAAAGKFLTPGLWDMHVHATRPRDQIAATSALPLYAAYGVVGVRDMGATLPELRAMRQSAAQDRRLPDIVASGPLLDGPRAPWQPDVALPLADVAAAQRAVPELAAAGVDFLKVYDRLSPEQYRAIAQAARKARLSFAGHIPMSIDLEAASLAGQHSIEHTTLKLVEDCTPDGKQATPAVLQAWIKDGYGGRYREFAAWAGRRDRAACLKLFERAARRGTWFTPTLSLDFVGEPWTRPEDLAAMSPSALSDCESEIKMIGAADADARRQALQAELDLVRDLRKAGAPILAGTDASNGCVPHGGSLHKELQLLHLAGLTNWQALRAATFDPARFLGRNDEGKVQVGAKANLLLLDADPLQDLANTLRIAGMARAGAWLSADDLARMRQAATSAASADRGPKAGPQ